jgi:hypothetical protein
VIDFTGFTTTSKNFQARRDRNRFDFAGGG